MLPATSSCSLRSGSVFVASSVRHWRFVQQQQQQQQQRNSICGRAFGAGLFHQQLRPGGADSQGSACSGRVDQQRQRLPSLGGQRMASSGAGGTFSVAEDRSYEAAIARLDALIGNASAQRSAANRPPRTDTSSRLSTVVYLERSGLTLAQLDTVPIVHVTGSKGKGSACAMVESILRSCGLRTAFYSSPHLVAVEERFRIDGRPLPRHRFTEYFWRVHDRLLAAASNPHDMPFYFQMLTVMAAHVAVGERVDVAVLEVGIGGEQDCTNIVRNTRVAGISAMGLEHTQILGDTLAEIAWQKAGIAKRPTAEGLGCTVWSVRQPAECVAVLRERCAEREAQLRLVPEWSEYRWPEEGEAQLTGPIYALNGSLAVQLAYDWMRKYPQRLRGQHGEMLKALQEREVCTEIWEPVARGLREMRWPGRFQRAQLGNMRLFLDGAHTVDSIRLCSEWFRQQTATSSARRYVLFNVTGVRSAGALLTIIREEVPQLEAALFAPTVAYATAESRAQVADGTVLRGMCEEGGADRVFASVQEAFGYLQELGEPVDVLVTGSLYMVGAACEILGEV